MKQVVLWALLALNLLCGFVFQSSAGKLPVEAFASVPDVDHVSLSPDGNKIISLVKFTSENRSGKFVNLYDLATGKAKALLFSDNDRYVITDLAWANRKKVLVWAKFAAARNRVLTTETRVEILDIDSGKVSPIVSRNFVKRLSYLPNRMDNVIDLMPNDDNHILMSMAGVESGGGHAVVKINLNYPGKAKVVQAPRSHVIDWLTDYQSRVRIGIALDEDQYTIFELGKDDGKRRDLWSFEAFSQQQVWPLAFDQNPDILFVKALYQGKDAIYKVDLNEKTLAKELVYFDPYYDVSGDIHRSPKTGEVIGIGNHFWSPSYKKLQAGIDKALADTNNALINFSHDETKYLLLSTSDKESGLYLIGDRVAKTVDFVAARYEQLAPELLSEKKAVSYQARDGLQIEGFLTVPKGQQKNNLPTIIFPHGGPISYDGNGFDYWTQFLANRGYAVFQMNFRGSSGYGHDFLKQGLQNWGRAMQDDVEDGTRWLIEHGIADKSRICIVGASYGGYAALMGAIKTPDLYQCVISFAGVTDLPYLLSSQRFYHGFELVKKQLGDDQAQLLSVSPVEFVDKINQPVLLIHGSKDRVVKTQHSYKMASRLKAANKQVDYLELEGADHYLSNNEHRLQTFSAIEAFLAEHLADK